MSLPKQILYILFFIFFTSIIIIGSVIYAFAVNTPPTAAILLAVLASAMSFLLVSLIFVTFYLLFAKTSNFSDDKITEFVKRLLANDYSQQFNVQSDDEHFALKSMLNELSQYMEKINNHIDLLVNARIKQTQIKLNSATSQNEMLKIIEQDLEKFKLAVTEAPIHIIITDSEGRIVYANKASSEISGYSVDEMIGKTPALWGKQMPKDYYARMWKTIKTDRILFKDEVKNRRKNGQIYDAEIKIAPILSHEDNTPIFFVGIEEDITQKKILDRMKSDFISLASHQLRTPITAIRWLIEGLIDNNHKYSESDKDTLEIIYKSTLRMVNLVKNLLNISRIQAGKLIIKPEPLEINNICKEVIANIEVRFKNKNPIVILNFDNDFSVKSDRELITNILDNLISNAVKYSDAEVNVNLKKIDHAHFQIIVKDHGIGIPETQKDKIFSRFFRASNTDQMTEEGSGLGLYMCKQIVDYLGGQIFFESKINVGTEFTVILPLDIKPIYYN